MPGNVGWPGLVVILLVLLLIFGPKRLPEMGRSLGRGMREFKDSITGNDKDEEAGRTELPPERTETTVTPAPPPASTHAPPPTQPESERVS